jgi:hypothetical protein
MKPKIFQIIFTGIMFCFLAGCKKEERVKFMVLSTTPVTEITTTSATSGGTLSYIGSTEIITNGVCWNTTGNPSTADSKTGDEIGNPLFVSRLSSLNAGTTYYLRAYATNYAGTSYGDELTFTTLCAVSTAPPLDTSGVAAATTEPSVVRPTLTTTPVSAITESSAISGGNITDDGGAPITDRGVTIFSVTYVPIRNAGGKGGGTSTHLLPLRTIHNGTGTGSFISNLTGLKPSTKYRVQSFAKNSAGSAYGEYRSFTTLPLPSPPTATTQPATNISTTGATLNGIINPNNSSTTITFEYGTTTSYGQEVIADYQSPVSGNMETAISATLTGLTECTYHFRVKAVNSLGISYGSDIEFTICNLIPTVSSLPATNITSTGATLNGTVNANGSPATVTFEYGHSKTSRYVYGKGGRGILVTQWVWRDVTATQSPVTGTTQTYVSANVTGLVSGTTHPFRIKAVNSNGTAYSSQISFTLQ